MGDRAGRLVPPSTLRAIACLVLLWLGGGLPGAAAPGQAPAGPAMTNGDVARLVEIGLPPELVAAAVRAARHRAFDTGEGALLTLRQRGVPEPVLEAMRGLGVAGADPAPLRPAPEAGPGTVAIDHVPADCVVAETFPRLEACLTPAADVLQARVVFRADGEATWYHVALRPEGDCFAAVLPKPRKRTRGIAYRIEVVDARLAASQTPEHVASIASNADRCRRLGLRPTPHAPDAAPTVGSDMMGAARVPPGFLGDGVVFVGAGSPAGPAE